MRVLVTGSREWTDRGVIRHALETLPRDTVIIHGAARGVDRIAGEIATELGFMVEPYPADWGTYGRKAAGPIRNRQMLVEGKPDVVYAFHDDLWKKSKGTKNMANQALHAGVPVILYSTFAPRTPLVLLHDTPVYAPGNDVINWLIDDERDVTLPPMPNLPNHPGTCDCADCNEAYGPRRKAQSDGSS